MRAAHEGVMVMRMEPTDESQPVGTPATGRTASVSPSSGPKPSSRAAPERVFFQRQELDAILRIYGRMVAAGEWRDYAIDGTREAAIFSVYRRASERPLYSIEKRPKLARRQGAYAVISTTGLILRRGHDLAAVLKVFERKRFRIVD